MWIYHVYGHDSKPIGRFVRNIQETISTKEPLTVTEDGSLIFRPSLGTQPQTLNECIVCVAPKAWTFVTVQWEEDKNALE